MTADVDEELVALVGLAALPGVGPASLLACLEAGAVAHWEAALAGRAAATTGLARVARRLGDQARPEVGAAQVAAAARALDPAAALGRHRDAGHHVLVRGRPGYPERLAVDPAPPALLLGQGDLAALANRSVAIVGTRNATRSGRAMAAELALGLSSCGVAVVSGLALGIDGAAHQAVVDLPPRRADEGPAWGPPIGVIASGLDIAYPRRHRDLHRSVAARGLVLTETPLGGRPVGWRFPARNRLIAALAEAVVVVESRATGGSMLTAAEALARDVPVLAVPGHPTAPGAAGTNDLIFDGAGPVRDLDDVLGALGLAGTRPLGPRPGTVTTVADHPDEVALLAALGPEARSLHELLQATGLSLDRAAEVLADLEVAGAVTRSGSWYERSGLPRQTSGRAR